MNKKNITTEAPIVKVLDSYYASASNTLNSGCGLTYRIRNFSKQPVQVRSRFGYSQIIEPCENYSGSAEDYEREQDGVWLDILFETRDVSKCYRIPRMPGNLLDKAIDDTLYSLISKRMNTEDPLLTESFSCSFGVCLNSLAPNYDSRSYISETFGVIIELNTTRPNCTYTDDVAEPAGMQMHSKQSDNNQGGDKLAYSLRMEDSNYEMIYLIDNLHEVGTLWTMRSGKPSKIKAIRNKNMNSGVYIYTSEKWVKTQPYDFIPIAEVCDDKLREYGLSYTATELLNTVRTKEYVDMKKDCERQLSEISKEHKKEVDELTKALSESERIIKMFEKKEAKYEKESREQDIKHNDTKSKLKRLSESSEHTAMDFFTGILSLVKKFGVLA